jgi:DnaJ-class molecular chaperone
MLDLYSTLDVTRDASPDDIKRAFRKLAKELHPDVNPSPVSARRFRAVSEAYDVLSDTTKRRQYDREFAEQTRPRVAAHDGAERFTRPRTNNHTKDRAAESFLKGADLHHTLTVSFLEAALGTRKQVALGDRRTVEITVPPLTQDGKALRLKGQGAAGIFGGAPGDLLVDVVVEPHPVFTRQGLDIHMNLAVTVPEAVQGASILIQTVGGAVMLKVPPGSNTDTVLRLRGMGLSQVGSQGDHYVTLKVMLPSANDDEFPRLVETWAKRKPYRVRG